MAKIKTIKLSSLSEYYHENDQFVNVKIKVVVKFHLIDIKLNMQYRMHLFVFNLQGEIEPPIFYPNWDEGTIYLDPKVSEDNVLGHFVYPLQAIEPSVIIEERLSIALKDNMVSTSFSPKYTKAFASLVPVTSYAAKWSNEYHFNVLFKK